MSDDRDLSLETDHLEEVIESTPPVQPVVVIQYRSRGIPTYVTILLLVLVALGSVAVYHRLVSRSRAWQWVPAQEVAQATSGPASPKAEPTSEELGKDLPALPPSGPAEVPQALALNSQPIAPGILPAPAGVLSPLPVATPAPSPADPTPGKDGKPAEPKAEVAWPPAPAAPTVSVPPPPAPSPPPASASSEPAARPLLGGALPVGFSVPSDPDNPFSDLAIARKPPRLPVPVEAAAPAEASEGPEGIDPSGGEEALPDRAALMGEIAKEAAQKKAEQRQLRDLKERARAEIDAESLRRVEADRIAFRNELAEIVKSGGKQAGQQIDNLCNRYGRNYDAALRARVKYILSHTNGRVSKETRVRQLRGYGVPEPGILDYLANDLHRLINSRNGPRDPNEVRVSAAKLLLRFELARDVPATPKEARSRPLQTGLVNPPGNSRVP